MPETEDATAVPAALPGGAWMMGGRPVMTDAKGHFVPLSLVKPMDLIIDETVRKMIGFATELSEQIARFRGHCFDDVGSLQALIAQDYGATLGGAKGNISLTTFDGCMRVTVKVADLIEFGPELQAAKRLVDECLTEWSENSRDEIRALVTRAFQVDKEGQINRSEIFMLMRVAIDDERWQRAMQAVRDSIRTIGSKTYFNFYVRPEADAKWQAISIDLASARGRS